MSFRSITRFFRAIATSYCLLAGVLYAVRAQGQGFHFPERDLNTIRSAAAMGSHTLPDTVTVANEAWSAMTSVSTNYFDKVKFKSNHTHVRFAINHAAKGGTSPWLYKLTYTIYGYQNPLDTNVVTQFTDTLVIGYNPSELAAHQDIAVKTYPGFYKAHVVVHSVHWYDLQTGTPTAFNNLLTGADTNFTVEAAMLYQPYTKEAYAPSQLGLTAASPTYNSSAKTLQVSWTPNNLPSVGGNITPAKYELEWTFAEDYTPSGNAAGPSAARFTFRNNATRITTTNRYYNIPVVYPRGYLIYRVRLVRPDSVLYKTPIYGPWNNPVEAGTAASSSIPAGCVWYNNNPLDGDAFYWNYTISFAEDGKYKHVLNYGDGLGKSRQALTRFNSRLNQVLVTQSLYDYEGRPAITTLPAPVDSVPFNYMPGVAISAATGKPYRAPDFDFKVTSVCPGEVPISPFTLQSRAARYYSPLNTDTAGFQKFVPDAGGFPFVRTILAPGHADRVHKAGGAGDSLQIGLGHETKMDYVSVEQPDLNALFGINGGWSNFYTKTVTRDPNGQASLSVKDYEGKEVMSALIGDGVDKARHAIITNDDLPPLGYFKEDKLLGAQQLTVGNTRTYNKSFYMDEAGPDTTQYIYSFLPFKVCTTPYIGLSVRAHYEYSITDECGVVKMTDSATLGTTGPVTSSAPVSSSSAQIVTSLQKGKHTLDKTLTVNTDEIYAAVDSFFTVTPTCLRTEAEFIREEVDKHPFPCPRDPSNPCAQLEAEMMAELYPGAKYGKYVQAGSQVSAPTPASQKKSIFDIIGVAPTNNTGADRNLYRYQDSCVASALGSLVISHYGTTYTRLDTVSASLFLQLYSGANRPIIARQLLPLHPEYCKLLACFEDTFAKRLEAIPDAAVAQKIGLYSLSDIVAKDPVRPRMMASPFFFTNIADSLRLFRGNNQRLDTLAAEHAWCACSDPFAQADCKQNFRDSIISLTFSDVGTRDLYFETLRAMYLNNRRKYVDMLRTSGGDTCGPCRTPRMKLIDPALVPIFYAPNGGLASATTPGSTTGLLNMTNTAATAGPGGSTVLAVINQLNSSLNANNSNPSQAYTDSLQAIVDSLTLVYHQEDSSFCSITADSVLSRLANCNTTAGQRAAIRDTLMAIALRGEASLGQFKPYHVRHALTSAGVTMSDLCHPYLMFYDWNIGIAEPPPVSCRERAFYEDAKAFFNRAEIISAFTSPSLGISFTLGAPLSTTNRLEADILSAIGTVTSAVVRYAPAKRTYTLTLFGVAAADTVQFSLRTDVIGVGNTPIFHAAGTLSIDTVHCLLEKRPAGAEGAIRKYLFFVSASRTDGALTRKYELTGWTAGRVRMAADRINDVALCVPCTEFRTLYNRFRDSMALFTVRGADHPLYYRAMRNFMNYELEAVYGEAQYRRFLQSCALADSAVIANYGAYATIGGTAAIATLEAAASALNLPVVPDLYYRNASQAGADTMFISYGSIPFAKLRTFNNLVTAAGGSVNPVPPTGYAGSLIVPAGTTASTYVTSSALVVGTGRTISIDMGGIWVSGYTLYPVFIASGAAPHAVSAGVAAIDDALFGAPIWGRFVPTRLATVNRDYHKAEKKALLAYTYAVQGQTRPRVLDTIQDFHLEANVAAFAGEDVSYREPSNPYRFTNLYHTSAANYLPGMTTLQTMLNGVGNLQGLGKIFIPLTADSLNVQNPPPPQVPNLRAYRCSNGLYWYRYYGAGQKLYNAYIRIPRYIFENQHPNLKLAGIRPRLGDTVSNRFTVLLINPAFGPTDTIEAEGYTDFDLTTAQKLRDVVLGNEAHYGGTTDEVAGDPGTVNLPNCEQQILGQAIYAGRVRYQQYIDTFRSGLRARFYAHVMSQIGEQLWMSYPDQRFGVTLYVYDRAGNRMATVPPAGINRLGGAALAGVNAARQSATLNTALLPAHTKVSTYQYNSVNQLVEQATPDGGRVTYIYDGKGNAVFSQNDKQKPLGYYSYTLYDRQNRVVETGEVGFGCPGFDPVLITTANQNTPPHPCAYKNVTTGYWMPWEPSLAGQSNDDIATMVRARSRTDVVYTQWDAPLLDLPTFNGTGAFLLSSQRNLRSRIASVVFHESVGSGVPPAKNYLHATHFSYDAAGNVAMLAQDFPELESVGQRFKRVDYDYALHSGKVEAISYNRGWTDQYYHRYAYDDDNRLLKVETSRDGAIWTRDAGYEYYDHGPLARTSLGHLRVQGTDYAYTLQGWLKAVNGARIPDGAGGAGIVQGGGDMGADGTPNTVHAADAYATVLDYFEGDYRAIGGSTATSRLTGGIPAQSRNLYNGNIARQATDLRNANLPQMQAGQVVAQYTYDQLNRIRRADNLADSLWSVGVDTTTTPYQAIRHRALVPTGRWRSNYKYDPDGNLTFLNRYHGIRTSDIGEPYLLDSLKYEYGTPTQNNRLNNVLDRVAQSGYGLDLTYHNPGSLTTRYLYDPVGNVIKDLTAELDSISWNAYGKTARIRKTVPGQDTFTFIYGYDGAGQRVIARTRQDLDSFSVDPAGSKASYPLGYQENTTYYVRDAAGNILAVYEGARRYGAPVVQWVGGIRGLVLDPVSAGGGGLTLWQYINGVIVPLYGTKPGFTAAIGAHDPGSQVLAPVGAELTASTGLLTQFLDQFAGTWEAPLASWSVSSGRVAAARSLARQLKLNGPDQLIAELVAVAAHPDLDARRVELTRLISTMPGIMRSFAAPLGEGQLPGDYDNPTDSLIRLDELGAELAGRPDRMATFLLEAYHGGEEQVMDPWFQALATSNISSLGAAGITSGSGPNHYTTTWLPILRSALVDGTDLRGDTTGYEALALRDFLNSWAPADSLYTIMAGGLDYRQRISYASAPGPYLEALVQTYGPAVLDTLVAAAEPDATQIFAGVTAAQAVYGISLGTVNPPPGVDANVIMPWWGTPRPGGAPTSPLLSTSIRLAEHHLYGSSRLGISQYWPGQYGSNWNWVTGQVNVAALLRREPWWSAELGERIAPAHSLPWGNGLTVDTRVQHLLGQKQYELVSHLGNVHATILDRRGKKRSDGAYLPAVAALYDYFPFGMLMPDRWSQDTSSKTAFAQATVPVPVAQHTPVQLVGANWELCGFHTLSVPWSQSAVSLAYTSPQVNTQQPCSGGPGMPNFVGASLPIAVTAGVPTSVQVGGQGIFAMTLEVSEQVGAQTVILASTTFTPSNWFMQTLAFTPTTGAVKLNIRDASGGPVNHGHGELCTIDAVRYIRHSFQYQIMTVAMHNKGRDAYRFGFNGQEKDNHIAGTGNRLELKFRGYDSRTARFNSRDPLQSKFPWNSSYAFAENDPISCIDLEGGEKLDMIQSGAPEVGKPGEATITITMDYAVVTTGVGALPAGSVSPKDFTNRFARGNTVLYMTALPTRTSAPQYLDAKYERLARLVDAGGKNGEKAQERLIQDNVLYYRVHVNYNYSIRDGKSLASLQRWMQADRQSRGIILTDGPQNLFSPSNGIIPEIAKFNLEASQEFASNPQTSGYGSVSGLDGDLNIAFLRSGIKDQTPNAVHEVGHNSAFKHQHGTGAYEYTQPGLQNVYSPYANDGNTKNILDDALNRSTL